MSDIIFNSKIYGETNQGLVRQSNEDSFICQYIWDDSHVLCAAIDGLGGYEGGEIAAEIARSTILKHIEDFASNKTGQLLKDAFIDANNEIIRQREARPKVAQMGCVASVGLLDLSQGILYVAHVGDSRIYQFSDGQLKKLTHDHSLVGYREEIGEMTEEAAMHHPKRNVIDRFLGEQHLSFDTDGYIEISVFPIQWNTQYLFCSDGLTDLVTGSQIARVLTTDISIEDKVKMLITKANEAGGKDNITVVIANIAPTESGKSKQQAVNTKDKSGSPVADVKKCTIWTNLLWCALGLAIGIVISIYLSSSAKDTEAKSQQSIQTELKPQITDKNSLDNTPEQ